jgi:predicted DNA-binding transcriptional regulator AlpA
MEVEREWIDRRTLVRLGYPYSRAHTYRMMTEGRFPRAHKLGDHQSSRIVWRYADIKEWFKRRGL